MQGKKYNSAKITRQFVKRLVYLHCRHCALAFSQGFGISFRQYAQKLSAIFFESLQFIFRKHLDKISEF